MVLIFHTGFLSYFSKRKGIVQGERMSLCESDLLTPHVTYPWPTIGIKLTLSRSERISTEFVMLSQDLVPKIEMVTTLKSSYLFLSKYVNKFSINIMQ